MCENVVVAVSTRCRVGENALRVGKSGVPLAERKADVSPEREAQRNYVFRVARAGGLECAVNRRESMGRVAAVKLSLRVDREGVGTLRTRERQGDNRREDVVRGINEACDPQGETVRDAQPSLGG